MAKVGADPMDSVPSAGGQMATHQRRPQEQEEEEEQQQQRQHQQQQRRLKSDEAACVNARMQASIHEQRVPWLIGRERHIDLLVIRKLMTRLREQNGPPKNPRAPDETVPIQAFQRAFIRLFYILRDRGGFEARGYDKDQLGYIGWDGACALWQDRGCFDLELNTWERIFITFDEPTSSRGAMLISVASIAIVFVSCFFRVLSTMPETMVRTSNADEGEVNMGFWAMEVICLTLLIVEYLMRICTVWAIRKEVLSEEHLISRSCAYDNIELSSPGRNILQYIISPWHVIDVLSIVPGLVVLSVLSVSKYDGFVVGLRLLRLARVSRTLRDTQLLAPVIVMKRTVRKSLKVLYVLSFNLIAGVLVSGSLMFFCERGTWNEESGKQGRVVGKVYNQTTGQTEDVMGESPFQSIPPALWWALITTATVGGNSGFASTCMGQVVTMATMVWSLIIIALGVGMVGGSFVQVWNQHATEQKLEAQTLRRELADVSASIHRVEPEKVAKLMMVEIWHDDGNCDRPQHAAADNYLGEACFSLPILADEKVEWEKTLPLVADPRKLAIERKITGCVTVSFSWQPLAPAPVSTDLMQCMARADSRMEQADVSRMGRREILAGTLWFKVVSASKLGRVDWSKYGGSSSPYARVFCYPNSPPLMDAKLEPISWHTSTINDCIAPLWDEEQEVSFSWYSVPNAMQAARKARARVQKGDPIFSLDGILPEPAAIGHVAYGQEKLDEQYESGGNEGQLNAAAMQILKNLARSTDNIVEELSQVRGEVQSLRTKVDTLQAPDPSALSAVSAALGTGESGDTLDANLDSFPIRKRKH
ncbi:unnamed protein product [Polarella glacialis]|uniref:Ion transport domain-containing protein n=1 Tax=Polarella glacialis TaxID=89957 RepID=A0A813KPW6_POLGL|nr:unnamed protein product [Polarella glacialis]